MKGETHTWEGSRPRKRRKPHEQKRGKSRGGNLTLKGGRAKEGQKQSSGLKGEDRGRRSTPAPQPATQTGGRCNGSQGSGSPQPLGTHCSNPPGACWGDPLGH